MEKQKKNWRSYKGKIQNINEKNREENTYAHRERERSLEDSKISTSKKSQRGEGRDKQRDTQGDKKDLCNNAYNE